MAMTQLEMFRATAAHEPHKGFLFYANFTSDLHKRVLAEYGGSDEELNRRTGMYRSAWIGLKKPDGYVKPDFSKYYEGVEQPEGSYTDENGCLHIPGSMYHFTRYISPLRNAEKFEELEAYSFPDMKDFTDDHCAEAVKDAHANGRVVCGGIGHMYESSWQVRGYEEFLMDMMLKPEWCGYILDRYKERNKKMAIAFAKAGADYLMTGDDVANQNSLMFSIGQWRSFMKTRWAEVYAAARAVKPDIQIWYHSDGNITDIIGDLVEIGVTILNPVQPECVDPGWVKKQFGKKLVLDGTVGTQTTMPFGTPGDVKKVIRERAETLGKDGALIISPTHVLEPEVPMENIKAFFDTCRNL